MALLSLLALCGAQAVAQTDGAALHGRVADAAGAPLAGFPLLVVDGGGRAVTLRTGKNGGFHTVGLAAGVLTVRLDAQGYAQLGIRCRVPAGQTVFVELFAAMEPRATLPAARCRIEPSTSDLYIID